MLTVRGGVEHQLPGEHSEQMQMHAHTNTPDAMHTHRMGLAAALPTFMVVSSTVFRASGGSQERAGAASTSLSRLAAL